MKAITAVASCHGIKIVRQISQDQKPVVNHSVEFKIYSQSFIKSGYIWIPGIYVCMFWDAVARLQ